MPWLLPSVIAAFVGTFVLTIVYFYLYTQDRQKFLLIWAIGWFLYLLRYGFMLVMTLAGEALFLNATYHLMSLASGALLLWGTSLFIGKPFSKTWPTGAAVIGAWTVLSIIQNAPSLMVTLPDFFFLGALYIWNGILLLRTYKNPEGKVVGGTFIVWGLHKMDYPFIQPVTQLAPWGYLLSAVIELSVAIGILVVYFKKMKQQVAEEEERFKSLFENNYIVSMIVDPENGRIVEANAAASKFYGWSREHLTSMKITDINTLSPDGVHAELKAAKNHQQNRFLFKHRRADGSIRDVEVHSGPIQIQGRTILHSTIHDITDRKRIEDSLRLNEFRLASLLELSEMSGKPEQELTNFALERAIVLTKSMIGYLAFLNADETVLTMYSWSRVAMQDCRLLEKPIDYPLTTCGLWGEAVRRRKAVITNDYQAPNPSKKGYPDGHIQIRRHTNIPLFDGDRIVLVAGVGNKEEPYEEDDVKQLTLMMDGMWKILKSNRAEKALSESEERFKRLVQNTSDLIMVLNERGVQMSVSGPLQKILGYAEQELVGTSCFDLIHPDNLDFTVKTFAEIVMQANASRRLEFRCRHKNGTWVATEAVATNLLYDPIVKGIVVNLRDISERNKFQEQLQQAMKMEAVGRLAGGVAHDFNNLLTAITGNIELAKRGLPESCSLSPYLNEVSKAADSAASLTHQLLAFSRKQIIEPKVINLNALVKNIEQILARILGEDIELLTIPVPDLGSVKVDPGQFEQVLMNLAVNARDAMPHGGKLIIESSNIVLDEKYCSVHPQVTPGKFVLLVVSDTGQGMSQEVKKRLFEPFFTTKALGQGTGLGLATILGVIEQAGGSIEVYSEVGKGTTFKIYLPHTGDAPEKPAPDVSSPDLPAGSETILVVEDDAGVRKVALMILDELGYRLLHASDGPEAVSLAESHAEQIHLLMTDVVMPGMNGRELSTRLLKDRPDMKVLFTSGYTEDVIVHHGVIEADLNFISKPYHPRALARKIRSVLDAKTTGSNSSST